MAYPDSDLNSGPDGGLDDSVVLSDDQLKEIFQSQQDIRLCESDKDKFQLITRTRDDLLHRRADLELLIVAYDPVFDGCAAYRALKDDNVPVANDDDAEKWKHFIRIAKDEKTRLACLKAVGSRWGRAVVQHNQWTSRPLKFCRILRTASIAVPEWPEARDELNVIMLEQHQTPRQCLIKDSPHPISQVHLEKLAASTHTLTHRPLAAQDLPHGFGFDKFGILVRDTYAAAPGTEDIPELSEAAAAQEQSGSVNSGNTIDKGGNNTASTAEQAAKTGEPSGPAGTEEAGTADTARTLLALQGGTGLSSPDKPEPQPVEPPSPGNSSDLSSTLTSPQDSPITASSSATDISASCHRENTNRELTSLSVLDAGDRDTADDSSRRVLRLRTNQPSYHGMQASNSAKPVQRPHSLPDTASLHKKQCCPSNIPSKLLAILDDTVSSSGHLLRAYMDLEGSNVPYGTMCHLHLQRFAEKIPKAEALGLSLEVDDGRLMADPADRRRRVSLSDIVDPTPLKKLRLSDATSPIRGSMATQEGIPRQDRARDEAYRHQMLTELGQAKLKGNSYGARTNNLVRNILLESKPPATDEAHFCTEDEATAKAELGSVNGPIFTQGQQQSRRGERRPISQFFRSMEDLGLDRTVSVQIPSCTGKDSFREKTLREVLDRFLRRQPTDDPWNLLDLHCPLPSKLPSFLEGDNCQFLLRIRDAALMGWSGERHVASIEDWSVWRNVTEWALLSEGGHNTAPHMDSHGYSTWIEVQEGQVGFGWMSHPTSEERDAWMAAPGSYTGGEWRYVILQPGDQIFFPSGTIHFVFRTREIQTFAVGGHILQWSGIREWIENVIAQLRHPDITNEQLDDAPKIISIAKELVTNRVGTGRIGEMGGQDAVTRFLALIEVRRSLSHLRHQG